MKKLFIIFLTLVLVGCAGMTPAEKKQTAILVGGILIVGAIAASQSGSSTPDKLNCHWVVATGTSGGSHQVCL